MTDTEYTFALDLKTRAIRSGNRWAIQRLLSDGSWDMIAAWTGGRRSLLTYCEKEGIAPTRDAEAALARLPESQGFRERA